ncbi:hypothetical protein AHF37_08567 [Paragonimus kellicotti]|nr:hypothetical protein AHF37_08567 [Paragonimus kellicotti]
MSEESLADRARKLMPSITTYNSDDSIDGEDLSSSQESDVKEPAEPITRHSPNLPNTDGTNQRTDGILPYLSDSPSDYSSSSSDEEREEAFSRLAQKLATVPVTEVHKNNNPCGNYVWFVYVILVLYVWSR